MGLGTDDFLPVLGVVVAAGHDHPHLVPPGGAQFQYFAVDLHSDGPGIGHDHGLAGEESRPVFFVVLHDVLAQGLDGGVRPQHALHLAQHLLAFLNGSRIRLLFQCIVGGVDEGQRVLV